MKYKHLFFDLDHTLWDFDANAKETLVEVYTIFQLENKGVIPFEDFHKLYKIHNEILWDRYHKGFITGEELKWKRMWRTLLDFKIADEELAKEMSAKFLEILPSKKLLFPHTTEVLDYLKEKNYDLHLITNGFEKTQHTKLTTSGLDIYFKEVVTSEGSNSVKPQKEIFHYALNKAGAQLHQSIMLGDNLEADIQGAMNVGMDNIFINHINVSTTLKPTFTVTNLRELKNIF
ncbi:MAG TPA: YjjG family noncanonical pyrimidine nucleotidase [Ferruginibacter sp.]|nr:YjjG family noncanonical pyrimidine nucleotidase [Ferruginibacter sp.]HPH90805.1 YjjG family noncanonical pyrimidine nucleotidase [Ferruginibacter sp.]